MQDQGRKVMGLSKRKKGLSMRDEILDKARALFFSEGFGSTSLRRIAKACGCTAGNVYNHFQSKEEMLSEILFGEMTSLISKLRPLENNQTESPVEQLRTFIKGHVEHILAQPPGKLLYFEMEMRHLLAAHRRKMIRMRNEYDTILRKIIRRGIDSGVFRDVNEKFFNYSIASTILRIRIWYSPKGDFCPSDISDVIFETFFYGLQPKTKPH